MLELLRTNDAVLLSFVSALLKEAGFDFHVADQNMSIAEGSIGVFPRRVLVQNADYEQSRRLLVDAGLESELRPDANAQSSRQPGNPPGNG